MGKTPKLIAVAVAISLTVAVFSLLLYSTLMKKQNNDAGIPGPKMYLSGQKVAVMTNHPHVRASEALADWFQRETGAVVQNLVINYEDMARFAIEDAASPHPQLDVIMFWYVDLGELAKRRVLADLTDFISENAAVIQPGDFVTSVYDPYTLYQGRRFALPYDGDTHVLFYRKSLLRKYNFFPPETWDDYLNISRTITEGEKDAGIFGSAIMAPDNPMVIVSSFMNRLGGYGGKLLDERGAPALDSPEAKLALESLVQQAKYALPSPLETDWEVSRDAFLTGRAAMVEQWTDIGVMAEDSTQSLIKGDWGVVRMPKGSGEKAAHTPALNAGFSLGLSSRAPNPDAARAYLLFANRPDITLKLNLINGGIDPVRVSVLKSPAYRDFAPDLHGAVQAALERAAPWPTVPEAPRLLGILTKYLILTLEGQMQPAEALDQIQAQWSAVLKKGD
ncbi:MAG: sugar ABC transporter substrate-binding protein [Pseudomonadota bacterium]